MQGLVGGDQDSFGGVEGGSLYAIPNAASDDEYHDGDDDDEWEDYVHTTIEKLPHYSKHAERIQQ